MDISNLNSLDISLLNTQLRYWFSAETRRHVEFGYWPVRIIQACRVEAPSFRCSRTKDDRWIASRQETILRVHDGGIKPRLVTVALEINCALSNVRTVGVNEEVKESHWLLRTRGHNNLYRFHERLALSLSSSSSYS